MNFIGSCTTFVLMLVVGIVERGIVLSVIWNWFMPDLFGFRTLSWSQAIAASLVLGSLAGGNTKSDKASSEDEAVWNLVWVYVAPLVTLVVAWIIKVFFF